jgi:Gas vesicle synthesis protein GvpO
MEREPRRERANVDERRRPQRSEPAPRRRPMAAVDAAKAGLAQVAGLTGREPEGVVSLEPAEGGWVVGVEVVEDRRIPSSTDVLGLYEAELNENGELIGISRTRRYGRGTKDSGELGR